MAGGADGLLVALLVGGDGVVGGAVQRRAAQAGRRDGLLVRVRHRRDRVLLAGVARDCEERPGLATGRRPKFSTRPRDTELTLGAVLGHVEEVAAFVGVGHVGRVVVVDTGDGGQMRWSER